MDIEYSFYKLEIKNTRPVADEFIHASEVNYEPKRMEDFPRVGEGVHGKSLHAFAIIKI